MEKIIVLAIDWSLRTCDNSTVPRRKKEIVQFYTETKAPLVIYRIIDATSGRTIETTLEEKKVAAIVDRHVVYTSICVDSFVYVCYKDPDFGEGKCWLHNAGDFCPKA